MSFALKSATWMVVLVLKMCIDLMVVTNAEVATLSRELSRDHCPLIVGRSILRKRHATNAAASDVSALILHLEENLC
jgi:hypothetical protein